MAFDAAAVAAQCGFDAKPGLHLKFTVQNLPGGTRQVVTTDACQKTEIAKINAEQRRRRVAQFARDPQHRAVTTKHKNHVRFLRERRQRTRGAWPTGERGHLTIKHCSNFVSRQQAE